MQYHKPVMANELVGSMLVRDGLNYIDCTLGDAGHTLEILKFGGKVLGLDVDADALVRAGTRIKDLGLSDYFTGIQGNFKNIDKLAEEHGFSQVAGVFYDLGYSSYQLEKKDLGLSFLKEQELDMRLDSTLGVTAADLVNALPERELANIFFSYSDERLGNRFARAIAKRRDLKKFRTTKDLADLIVDAAPSGYEHGRIHPATRVFQALRIAVNDEITNLTLSLPRAAALLLPGGRMAVISFHSLEDKTVKDFGRSARPHIRQVTEKPLVPGLAEVEGNSMSRSAKLRVFEKIDG
ncbi:MAG: Ribosomal RNA small subunit methyltransferase H [candidate division WWE3 bacterium GW2011_GWA1_41_8]|uniref:Ribosomal RNA small subunit methyltransferase H n=2 Tax=Katanobacteria TaxID=422282 RepID=A0A0G0ZKS0_UNCKA|nr:MAG: Ribosomal RNA small subunit methyltransferase H [candidate division WWE3 bacterium GW2011_GWB1_41_6]KKS22636.1 MAG: Ribosomal RNA small subunit methyltransferase H [candidate division WWE3 bacterium GW2011_GWA1_41_8]